MFRYKITFGDKATSRLEETQRTEVNIKCKVLNKCANPYNRAM